MMVRKRLKRWLYGSCPGISGSFPYFGTRVFFPPGSGSFRAACEQGIYEADIVRLVQKLARPRTHVFDVGANIGLMALPLLRHCPDCDVVSFEPSPTSLPYLRRTISRSSYAQRWQLVEKAMADSPGELDFAIGSAKDSLYEGFRSSGRIPGAAMVKVPVSTLDAEWNRLRRPQVSVVKIDVEGAEGAVLDGSIDLIGTCRPHVIVEWHAQYLEAFGRAPTDLLGIAARSGYGIFSIPHGVPVTDARALAVLMLTCSNFLLFP